MWSHSRSLSFEGDSHSGPYLSRLNFCAIFCSLFDFCAIYFTTETLFLHYYAPLLEEFKNFYQVILKYTIIISDSKS